MNVKNIDGIVDEIQQDPNLKTGDKLIICLDRSYDSMLEDACLLTADGKIQDAFWTTYSSGDQADEAAVRLVEDGDNLVAFHESRPSSRDGRPNGIRVHHEDLDFPCVVFYNSGKERLTVDGEWVEPREYTSVQEVDPHSPEGQKVLQEYLKSLGRLDRSEEPRRLSYRQRNEERG